MTRITPCTLLAAVAALGAAGCATSGISTTPDELPVPAGWAREPAAGSLAPDWLATFDDSMLDALVGEAIAANFALQQERERLESARQAVVILRADRYPALDVSLGGTRRDVDGSAGGRFTNDSYDAGLGASFEVDLWQRLSDRQRAAELDLAAREARLAAARLDVAGATAAQYFTVMEATQLFEVAERRLANAIESRDIVASGYRQGLNDALDLYLARNQVERERANLALAEQDRVEAIAELELTLARYPGGELAIGGELPVIADPVPAGLPSELLTRRPDVEAAWLDLLAADAELAAAHKARFPSLSLVGNTGVASDEFGALLDGGVSTWSLSFGLVQPLFEAGRLEAREAQALAAVRLAEQAWLELVYRAFADVENAISRAVSLEDRYEALLEAEKNSRAALELALEQYQRGLVTYTTVLESQRQAFDAEATVVSLKNQRLQNRIALHLALGGDFAVPN